jgi:hypothetical protein
MWIQTTVNTTETLPIALLHTEYLAQALLVLLMDQEAQKRHPVTNLDNYFSRSEHKA